MSAVITLDEVKSLIPERQNNASKYDYGRLLALCGSVYYRGAAVLSCGGALRCGAGIVTLASTEKVITAVASNYPECTFLPMAESENGTLSADNCRKLIKESKKYGAMLIGCGLSIDRNTRTIVKNLITEAECRLIIDADGLNILSEDVELLRKAKLPPIITPHHGEMARLCKKSRQEVGEAPLVTAERFASRYNCTVVLKAHTTYIATPEKVAINNEVGNPGLAKGGSGDLLAGMIASFCAQGMPSFEAAKCGVYLHGLAADKCAERLSVQAMLPSDVLVDLCTLFS